MADYNEILKQLEKLDTERINPDTINIDRLPALDIVRKINEQDQTVAATVAQALGPISQAAEIFAHTLKQGHRVFYIGAGTSGRLGVLDAAECPPTFSTDPDQIVGVISGGYATLVLSLEGVEDNATAAETDLREKTITGDDFLVGIAASVRTPYTQAGLRFAQSLGCRTAFIVCNKATDLEFTPDVLIELPVGPEAITGSTRMKSGTAQKMALNMISTTAMVLLGKTYGNLMVDLQCNSEKLSARARRILMELLDIPFERANELLHEANGSAKRAFVMGRLKCSAEEAKTRLDAVDGIVSNLFETEE